MMQRFLHEMRKCMQDTITQTRTFNIDTASCYLPMYTFIFGGIFIPAVIILINFYWN